MGYDRNSVTKAQGHFERLSAADLKELIVHFVYARKATVSHEEAQKAGSLDVAQRSRNDKHWHLERAFNRLFGEGLWRND